MSGAAGPRAEQFSRKRRPLRSAPAGGCDEEPEQAEFLKHSPGHQRKTAEPGASQSDNWVPLEEDGRLPKPGKAQGFSSWRTGEKIGGLDRIGARPNHSTVTSLTVILRDFLTLVGSAT